MDIKTQRNSCEMSDADLSHWHEILKSMPDIRLDRVLATRDALKFNRYDDENILDETVNRLQDEFDSLCRETSCD